MLKYIWIIAASFFVCALKAQSPVTMAIGGSYGNPIPQDFVGLSFETESVRLNSTRVNGRLFDSTNSQLLTLFGNLGIRNLRIGGDSVDSGDYTLINQDIDALFRFAKAANVKVVYSLGLLNGDPSWDAIDAQYVWEHYRPYLDCFAVGNEPNLYKDKDPEITNDATFYNKWRAFATVISKSVPDAKFGGPDTGGGGTSWAAYFAQHEAGSGLVNYVFAHYYVGGSPRRKEPQRLIDAMLSPDWDNARYPAYFDKIGAMSSSNGFPYRLTEFNSYVAPYPGVWGGNNSFATALFALDSMHWWAEHGCAGVNFHTVIGKYNGTVYPDADGNYQVYPIAYGIKAFDVGGHGKVDAVTVTNPDHLNLTAYAVTDTNNTLFITIINKEHNAGARSAAVTIAPGALSFGTVEAMFLAAANGDVGATDGVTLGGAHITNHEPWSGKWTSLKSDDKGCVVIVPPASAAILKISNR